MDGVLVVDKPAGPTSHDVVDRVRRALREKRVGHTGTLDPFATGVLPLCIGKATRLARFLSDGDKEYRASVRLGFATTTDDLTGEPLGEPRPVSVLARDVERRSRASWASSTRCRRRSRRSTSAAAGPTSWPGAARRRRARPPRVTVHAIELVAFEDDRLELSVRCSPGTYVRALARDLGEALGVGGHLTALRRTRSGAFDLSRAVPADDARAGRGAPDPARGAAARDAGRGAAAGVAGAREERAGALARDVASGFPCEPVERVRLVDESGQLVALAVPRGFGPATERAPAVPAAAPGRRAARLDGPYGSSFRRYRRAPSSSCTGSSSPVVSKRTRSRP